MSFLRNTPRWFSRTGGFLGAFMVAAGIVSLADSRPTGFGVLTMGVLVYSSALFTARNGHVFGVSRQPGD